MALAKSKPSQAKGPVKNKKAVRKPSELRRGPKRAAKDQKKKTNAAKRVNPTSRPKQGGAAKSAKAKVAMGTYEKPKIKKQVQAQVMPAKKLPVNAQVMPTKKPVKSRVTSAKKHVKAQIKPVKAQVMPAKKQVKAQIMPTKKHVKAQIMPAKKPVKAQVMPAKKQVKAQIMPAKKQVKAQIMPKNHKVIITNSINGTVAHTSTEVELFEGFESDEDFEDFQQTWNENWNPLLAIEEIEEKRSSKIIEIHNDKKEKHSETTEIRKLVINPKNPNEENKELAANIEPPPSTIDMDIVEVVENREGNVSSQRIPDEPKTDLSEPENDDTGNEVSATA